MSLDDAIITYQTQIKGDEANGWRAVEAGTMEDAAIEAVRAVGPHSVTWPCTVYVGEPEFTKDGGTPLVCRGFELSLKRTS